MLDFTDNQRPLESKSYDFLGMTAENIYNRGIFDALVAVDSQIVAISMTNGNYGKVLALREVRKHIVKLWRLV